MRIGRSATALTVLALGTLGCAIFLLMTHDGSLQRLQQGDALRIGYAVEAPFALVKPGGEVSGEALEMAKCLAARLGIKKVEFRNVEFRRLLDELESGHIYIVASGMFITPERARRVAFSEPTLHVTQGLLVGLGNPLGLHAYEDAVKSRTRIAVLSGAVEEGLLTHLNMPRERLLKVPDALTGRVAVESGQADGLALSAITIRSMASGRLLGRTEMAEPFRQPELPGKEKFGYTAFAFRKKDKKLREAWNETLRAFLGSPEHLALLAEFGLTETDLPQNVTTEMILRP